MEKLKVYIASKFASRTRLLPYKRKLQEMGFEVLSKWMEPGEDTLGADLDSLAANLEESQRCANRDIYEVSICDIFIIDITDESNTGGRECELGEALYRREVNLEDILIYKIGHIRNVFHALVHPIKDWEAMMVEMRRVYEKYAKGS